MRAFSIVLTIVLIALLGFSLDPVRDWLWATTGMTPDQYPDQHAVLSQYVRHIPLATLAIAGLLFLVLLFTKSKAVATATPVKAEAAKPAPPPITKNQAEAEVVSFLAALQDKGRLVDFLMDDISAYKDAQVGAAARVVHEGCKSVLNEHFTIHPIRDEKEGSGVTVSSGYLADEYRFVGKISGEPPFSGTLVHKGWKSDSVKLPRIVAPSGDRLPTIAPAEVELK